VGHLLFNSYSFDSRYYGAIPESSIRHHLRPLWTFATEVPQHSVVLPAVFRHHSGVAWSGHSRPSHLSLVAPLLVYHAEIQNQCLRFDVLLLRSGQLGRSSPSESFL